MSQGETRPHLTIINTLEHPGIPHPPGTKDQQQFWSHKSDTPAPAVVYLPDTLAPTNTEDLDRDRPTVSGMANRKKKHRPKRTAEEGETIGVHFGGVLNSFSRSPSKLSILAIFFLNS
ncbi:uncharacterized protein LOC127747802 [Arachis duranensis]|uniref:Uncharacterized protein LOC127747802 n=1 Tax=Arachis duranensis TaxID=130453 RepID=A0A9C6WU17_ARADU|nr:uncharacterized protein LOC127747802 [Arachis duranensis]